MELAPGTAVDRYTIEGVLGRGGMAVVYRARHNQLGTAHAVKVLTLPLASIRQRMLQEGRVQAAMRHPNIVNVTDVVDVGGAPGLVMELIEGPSLFDLLERGPLSAAQVDALAHGIIAGVAEAHRHGLIHRDLKPANILIAVTPRGLVPKVTDFGLAKVLDTSGGGQLQTVSGTTMGTPQYMAPEQVRNAKGVDRRADIFALGCILYEMLTARRPFDGQDLLEVFTAIAGGRFTPILELAPHAPERMCRAIEAALIVDRDERIADCDALLAIWTGQAASTAPIDAGPWDGAMLARAAAIQPAPGDPTLVPWPAPAPAPDGAAAPARRAAWVIPLMAAGLLLAASATLIVAAAAIWYSTQDSLAEVATVPAPAAPEPVVAEPEPVVVEEPPAEAVVGAPEVPVRAAVARPVAVATRAEPAPEPPVVTEMGDLVVTTRPWSDRVTVDGTDAQRTPWRGQVPAGTRTITMHASDGREVTRTLEVPAGSSTELCWDFDLGSPCVR